MWNWNENTWGMIDEVDILIMLDKASQNRLGTINNTTKNMYLEALKRVARQNKPSKSPETWVQFKDCIIDLKDKEIIRYKPSHNYFITKPSRISIVKFINIKPSIRIYLTIFSDKFL